MLVYRLFFLFSRFYPQGGASVKVETRQPMQDDTLAKNCTGSLYEDESTSLGNTISGQPPPGGSTT